MKVTLLTKNQLLGENKIENISISSKPTDFAISQEVYRNRIILLYGKSISSEFAEYFLKDAYEHQVLTLGTEPSGLIYTDCCPIFSYNKGIRPVIEFSSVDEIDNYGVRVSNDKLKLGAYMDNILSKEEQIKWNNALLNDTLEKCGSYTLYLRNLSRKSSDNYEKNYVQVYELNGKKAIHINYCNRHEEALSDNEKYEYGDSIWIEVKDKIWPLDEKNLVAVSEEVILCGIQFNNQDNYESEEDFLIQNMYKYLNDIFLPELMQFHSIALDNSNFNSDELVKKIRTNELVKKSYYQQKYIKELEEKVQLLQEKVSNKERNEEKLLKQIKNQTEYIEFLGKQNEIASKVLEDDECIKQHLISYSNGIEDTSIATLKNTYIKPRN